MRVLATFLGGVVIGLLTLQAALFLLYVVLASAGAGRYALTAVAALGFVALTTGLIVAVLRNGGRNPTGQD